MNNYAKSNKDIAQEILNDTNVVTRSSRVDILKHRCERYDVDALYELRHLRECGITVFHNKSKVIENFDTKKYSFKPFKQFTGIYGDNDTGKTKLLNDIKQYYDTLGSHNVCYINSDLNIQESYLDEYDNNIFLDIINYEYINKKVYSFKNDRLVYSNSEYNNVSYINNSKAVLKFIGTIHNILLCRNKFDIFLFDDFDVGYSVNLQDRLIDLIDELLVGKQFIAVVYSPCTINGYYDNIISIEDIIKEN